MMCLCQLGKQCSVPIARRVVTKRETVGERSRMLMAVRQSLDIWQEIILEGVMFSSVKKRAEGILPRNDTEEECEGVT